MKTQKVSGIRFVAFVLLVNPAFLGVSYSHGSEAVQDGGGELSSKSKPDDAEVYFKRGRDYAKKGELDKAIADFSHSIRLDPTASYVYFNRGYAYQGKGNYDKAIEDYLSLIHI